MTFITLLQFRSTVLHEAAFNEHAQVVETLIRLGIDFNVFDDVS